MIQIEHLNLTQGDFSLCDISFEIPVGQYGVLMGPSGCGKTTIMETLCGLRKHSAGRILLASQDVTAVQPGARQIGYVPQDSALFPGLLVREQLAFGLVVRKRPQVEIRARVNELAETLGIEHLLDRLPNFLSGGERQRVALGRALATLPAILCLDEPLGTLDDHTHNEMVALLKNVTRALGVTALHITHSYREAQQLADIVYVMDSTGLRRVVGGNGLDAAFGSGQQLRSDT